MNDISPAEPRELVGRHAHQVYLQWCDEFGKRPPSQTRDWTGLLKSEQEAFMRIGAALFDAGRGVGTEYDDLVWLLGAGVEMTIGHVERDGMTQVRVLLDLDDEPELIGNTLLECLARAKALCEAQGIGP